jgi:hypothetical protein
MTETSGGDLWVYANAIRRLCREYGLTYRGAVELFGPSLVHVRCNIVTGESVRALLGDKAGGL